MQSFCIVFATDGSQMSSLIPDILCMSLKKLVYYSERKKEQTNQFNDNCKRISIKYHYLKSRLVVGLSPIVRLWHYRCALREGLSKIS